MTTDVIQCDIGILGGGPGGYAAAFFARDLGLETVVVETSAVGGTCLHRGCIPAKTWLHLAETYRNVKESGSLGVTVTEPTIDWDRARSRKDLVVSSLTGGLERAFVDREIQVVPGRGKLNARNEIVVEGPAGSTIVRAPHLILATGSSPQHIPGFTVDGHRIVDSDKALDWPALPSRVVIVGGGAIGCEFASMLIDLGSQVDVIEMTDQVIPGIDVDAARELQGRLRRRGVKFHLGATAGRPELGADSVRVPLDEEILEADVVLVAVGRRPNTDDLGLDHVGVELDRGFVKVERSTLQTSAEGVFAVGDIVAGTPQLAHAAFAEALSAVHFIASGDSAPVDYRAIPLVVYTSPEVAQIGLTEALAAEMGIHTTVHQRKFAGVGRAVIKGEKRGLVKLVVGDDDVLVGASVVGPDAGEMIHELMITQATKATVSDVARLIHAHPSLSEAAGETLLEAAGLGLH